MKGYILANGSPEQAAARHQVGQEPPRHIPRLWVALTLALGVVTFGMPLVIWELSWASTCAHGSPAVTWKIVAMMVTTSTLLDGALIWQRPLWKDYEGIDNSHSSPMFWLASTQHWKVLQGALEPPQEDTWSRFKVLGAAGFTFGVGKLETADQDTDFMLPGQIQACELEYPSEEEDYERSWQNVPIIGPFVPQFTLHEFANACLWLAYCSQLFFFVYFVFWPLTKWLMQRDLELDGDAAKTSLALETMSAGLTACGLSGTAAMFFDASLQATRSMINPMTTFRNPKLANPHLVNMESKARRACPQVFTRTVVENCPSTINAIAFLAMSFDGAGYWTKVKTLLTLLTSIGAILAKCVELFSLRVIPFDNRGTDGVLHHDYTRTCTVLVIVLLLFCVGSAVKLYFAFVCESHLFSLTRWSCVARE